LKMFMSSLPAHFCQNGPIVMARNVILPSGLWAAKLLLLCIQLEKTAAD
jgi:hypothetical protein